MRLKRSINEKKLSTLKQKQKNRILALASFPENLV